MVQSIRKGFGKLLQFYVLVGKNATRGYIDILYKRFYFRWRPKPRKFSLKISGIK